MKVLTEADLRSAGGGTSQNEYRVSRDTFVTPLAKEYMRDHKIRLVIADEDAGRTRKTMTVSQRLSEGFVDAATGERLESKPEMMTHLRANLLVPKTHPRIELRGFLDSLQAQILLLQHECRREDLRRDLGSVLEAVKEIMGAEVKEEQVTFSLFGLSLEEIHRQSYQVKETFGMGHPVPEVSMGEMALRLNLLRTDVRKAELAAARSFPDGDRLGIVEGLNRLSSGVYVLFCRVVSGYYAKE